ncbi:hypothetical protein PPYR_12690 [Photinus pyralis]|uniref:DUF4794 domain-containing protein n=1 Tax=Photinus pyralis TaxID=7054 RepID=A0A5N4A6W5_PHOPY|nr:extensin-like [Photinus pyralis]KAB0793070.1 hypothetical protein PPYR_12690 [Photinus pyralis]
MKINLVDSAVVILVLCNASQTASVRNTNDTDTAAKDVRPLTVLEYKPISSFHHPEPFTLGQLVSAGTPWPDSANTTHKPPPSGAEVKPTTDLGNQSSTTSSAAISSTDYTTPSASSVENRFGEEVNNLSGGKPAIVLGYKPSRPPYVPDPVTIGQLIPAGTPWPDSPEGYQTTIKPDGVNNATVKPITVLEYKPTRPSFLPEPSTIAQLVPSGTPWPASANTTLKPQPSSQSEDELQSPATVLEYKPTRPSFLPEPVTIGQLIPSGTPWPDSPAGYKTTTTTNGSTVVQEVKTTVLPQENNQTRHTTHKVLEYTPQRPWYLPEPVTIGQLIPPGTPWPASPTVKPPKPSTQHGKPQSTRPPPHTTNRITQKPFSSTHIILGYKPTRPWYLPEPVTIGQIISPGKPWPASADDFSANVKGIEQTVGNSQP